MGKPSWENLDDFLALDAAGGFARPATITLQSGAELVVHGIFDDPYLNAQLGEYEHDTSDPRFLCKASAVTSVRRGDELELDGKTYDVMTTPQDDGTGMATVKLAPR
jgi:hypothetical protein